MSSLKTALKKDSKYKKFKRIVLSTKELNLDSLLDEIANLHSSRASRLLKAKNISPKALIDANVQDQAYRSRLVEILVMILRQYGPLELAYGVMQDYISTHFADLLPVRAKADRAAYLRSGVLHTAWTLLSKLERVRDSAQEVIADIDKTAWALKNMLEGMSMIHKGETMV